LGTDIPAYAYHYTHIENAVSILRDHTIRSRAACNRLGINHHDSASPSVIANTHSAKLEYVRLYFRPKTPTQYHCEGIRPEAGLTIHKAHCPVPVFFLYDLVDLLGRPTTEFSDGNMGSSSTRFGDSLELFDSIPFANVYHDGYRSTAPNPARVINDRCAEVLVPQELSTDGLRFIVCRSHAERRTLLYNLPLVARIRYERLVHVGRGVFFYREWAFVDEVVGAPKTLTIRFNPVQNSSQSTLSMEFFYDSDGMIWTWSGARSTHEPLVMNLAKAGSRGVMTFKIEGHQAFHDKVVLDDEPF
jgi:hypothetical protein